MSMPSAPPSSASETPYERWGRDAIRGLDRRMERVEALEPRVVRLEEGFGRPADTVAKTPATGLYEAHERIEETNEKIDRLTTAIDALRAAVDADRKAREKEEQQRKDAADREAAATIKRREPWSRYGWGLATGASMIVVAAALGLLGAYLTRHWSWEPVREIVPSPPSRAQGG